jgi:predicted ferric reductase
LLVPLYLLLGFHSVVLAKSAYWDQPVGWMLAAMLAAGGVSAVLVLIGRVGARRKVQGTVEAVRHYPALKVVETHVAMDKGWPGHDAGQFAFLTSHRQEGAHPYTIASAWHPVSGIVTFITKALGDHTGVLHELLKPGMRVTVEGPYGDFTFSDAPRHQIWVAAGIGITPFLARMKQLASEHDPVDVELFVATPVDDADAIGKLSQTAANAGVKLHVLVSGRHGRLDGERLRAAVPSWRKCSVWFCGPARFGEALKADLVAHGLPAARFHQELFELR